MKYSFLKSYLTNFIALISILLINYSCSTTKMKADLILYNANILTLNDRNETAHCLAVKKGKIVAVGTEQEIREHFVSGNTFDAKNLFVYPGFIDAHSHFTGYAEYLRYADLTGANSFEDVLAVIAEYHRKHPGSWIVGRGWDQNKWENKQFPEFDKLNHLYPSVPVVLTRIDGHAVLVNQAALKASGLKEPFPKGEAILKMGKITGVFLEQTADKLKASIPTPTDDEFSMMISDAAAHCFSVGLTSVTDAGIDKSTILFLDSLQQNNALKIRIDAMINPTKENMDYFMSGKKFGSDWLRVGAVKVYADGALGSRGACLLSPYSDEPSNYGLLVLDEKEFARICESSLKSGFQVNTHAIGDSAIRVVLNTYAKYLKGHDDLRWRIEHAQVVDADDFSKFGKYSVIPSVQATHATSDMSWAEARLGSNRIRNAYAYKKLMDENGWIPNGTDFPIEDISPIKTFYAATIRKDLHGNPAGGFQPENAISRLQALKSITIWAAKAAFLENKTGSIEKGKFADLVILDKDLLSVPEDEILNCKVHYTFVNGELVYSYDN